MSEEEKIIEDLTEFAKQESKYRYGKQIQGLLDLYQKEKEKNKELEEDLHDNKEYIRELHHKLTNAIEIKYIHEDYIPKSKVRELYEHYKDTGYYELESVLQELLEERN